MRTTTPFLLALLAIAIALAPPAAAHASKLSLDGELSITWGFLYEPAVTLAPNAIEIILVDPTADEPVTGLKEGVIEAEVQLDSASMELEDLEERPDAPGHYVGLLTPTRAAEYTLHFFGSIRGETVNVQIPGGESVRAVEGTYFPPRQDAAAARPDPSTHVEASIGGARDAPAAAWAPLVGLVGAAIFLRGRSR